MIDIFQAYIALLPNFNVEVTPVKPYLTCGSHEDSKRVPSNTKKFSLGFERFSSSRQLTIGDVYQNTKYTHFDEENFG